MNVLIQMPTASLFGAARAHIVPHLSLPYMLGYNAEALFPYEGDSTPAWRRIRDAVKDASFVLLGYSGADANEWWFIEACIEFKKPLGVIIQSSTPLALAPLSVLHGRKHPLQFVAPMAEGEANPSSFFRKTHVFPAGDLAQIGINIAARIQEAVHV